MSVGYGEKNIIDIYSKPTLDLQFVGPKASLNARIGNVTVGFARTSVGTYVDKNKIIKTAVADEARFDHDPVTGESLGLLVEESRANIYKYSNLMNPSSGSTPSNFTANAGTAPDGTNTAFKLVQKPSSDGVTLQGQTFAIGSKDGPNAVFSVYAKAGEDRYLYITPYLSQSLIPPVFDLQTGEISNPGDHAAVMDPLADGWYRCSMRVRRGGFASMRWGISNVADAPFSNNGIPFEGDGNSGLFVWGPQYEMQTPNAANGDSPIQISVSSFIPTAGSTVTRYADTAQMTGTNFSNWFDSNRGTIFAAVKGTGINTTTGTYSTPIFYIGDGGNTNRIVGVREVGAANIGEFVVATNTGASVGLSTISSVNFNTDFDEHKIAARYGNISTIDSLEAFGDSRVSVGATYSSDFSAFDRAYFGYSGLGPYWNGHIKNFTYWNQPLSNNNIKSLTRKNLIDTDTIVSSGLMLNFDAGDSNSYSGSGNTWYDLSGNGYNATLTNGPTYSSDNGGYFQFDGTNDHAVIDSGFTVSTSNVYTIEAWILKESGTVDGYSMLMSGGNETESSERDGIMLTTEYYGTEIPRIISRNGSADVVYYYGVNQGLNGGGNGTNQQYSMNRWVHIVITVQVNNVDGGPHHIGQSDNNTGNFDGKIAVLRVYNRELSQQEVTYNYNITKERFV